MAKMNWSRVERERRASSHEPLSEPHEPLPTERQLYLEATKDLSPKQAKRQDQADRRRFAELAELKRSYDRATRRVVARVMKQRKTRDPLLVARDLGISRASALRYLSEIARSRSTTQSFSKSRASRKSS